MNELVVGLAVLMAVLLFAGSLGYGSGALLRYLPRIGVPDVAVPFVMLRYAGSAVSFFLAWLATSIVSFSFGWKDSALIIGVQVGLAVGGAFGILQLCTAQCVHLIRC
jgi:hypothetical protein